MENKVKVTCPVCNWLLMNRTKETIGKIEIKCTRCRQIVQVELKNHK